MCPQLELAAYGNVYIQSLYELEFKKGFVKTAVSRSVRLRVSAQRASTVTQATSTVLRKENIMCPQREPSGTHDFPGIGWML